MALAGSLSAIEVVCKVEFESFASSLVAYPTPIVLIVFGLDICFDIADSGLYIGTSIAVLLTSLDTSLPAKKPRTFV